MWCEMANEFSQKLEEFSELNDPVVVAFAGLYVISWPAHTYSLLLTKPDSFFAVIFLFCFVWPYKLHSAFFSSTHWYQRPKH